MHLKGKTECFECQPRPTPKGFPICTIRNTPEKPIHCIVWAKDLLFERLFGAPEETNDLDEVTAADTNATEADIAAAAGAAPALSMLSLSPESVTSTASVQTLSELSTAPAMARPTLILHPL